MKKTSKRVALFLSAMLAVSALAGCSNGGTTVAGSSSSGGAAGNSGASAAANGSLPELKFNITTVGFGADPTGTMIQNKWLEECGKAMGVKLSPNYTYVNMNDYRDKIQIILTGGDIPDLLSWGWVPNSQAAMVQYGEQGLYLELTQHLDKLPNYKAVLEEAKNTSAPLYSQDGKIYGFYGAQYQPDGNNEIYGAAAVRKDILDANNLPIPQTIEEFTKTAQALKKAYPDKYPMLMNEEWQRPESTLALAYHSFADFQNGSNSRFYDDKTKSYQFGPITDGYKQALTVMHQWYTEGLISPDYFTQKSADGTAAVANGDAMMIPSVWWGYPGGWAKPEQYPDQKWVLIPSLKAEGVDNPWSFYGGSPDKWTMQNGYAVVVGAKSKVADQMLQLMDLQYSKEILTLLNWGIAGETFEEKDGERSITAAYLGNGDAATAIGWGQGTCRSGIFPNPQDLTAVFAQYNPQDYYYQGKLITGLTAAEFMKEHYDANMAYPDSKLWPKPQPLTTDEAQTYANIMTPVETYAQEQEAKFVKGDRSLDEWPAYLEEINKMGDIQKAMDIYNAKLPK